MTRTDRLKRLLKWSMPLQGFLLLNGFIEIRYDAGSELYARLMNEITPDRGFMPGTAALLTGLLCVYGGAFYWSSYRASLRQEGQERFVPVFMGHFFANYLSAALTFVLFFAFSMLLGRRLGPDSLMKPSELLMAHVPTIQELPAWLAMIAGMLLAQLPTYAIHLLAHKSRLIWLTTHRAHHSAEVLHPMGIGPFMFLPIFTAVPTILLNSVCTKLFHRDPLWLESIAFVTLAFMVEKFSHSTPFYNFAYRNPLVRAFSAFTGKGVYHYRHHSSMPGEETVNLGEGVFLFWDRLFGTYRAPTAERPRVGLTGNPSIRLEPVALLLGGWQQILFELNENKDWKTRFRILFGSASYTPPVSKSYLLL